MIIGLHHFVGQFTHCSISSQRSVTSCTRSGPHRIPHLNSVRNLKDSNCCRSLTFSLTGVTKPRQLASSVISSTNVTRATRHITNTRKSRDSSKIIKTITITNTSTISNNSTKPSNDYFLHQDLDPGLHMPRFVVGERRW